MRKIIKKFLSPVVSERHLYLIAMQDLRKPKEPRFQDLEVGKRYTRDQALAKAASLNVTCSYELSQLDFTSFVVRNANQE
jgi:hypothetical protein